MGVNHSRNLNQNDYVIFHYQGLHLTGTKCQVFTGLRDALKFHTFKAFPDLFL